MITDVTLHVLYNKTLLMFESKFNYLLKDIKRYFGLFSSNAHWWNGVSSLSQCNILPNHISTISLSIMFNTYIVRILGL